MNTSKQTKEQDYMLDTVDIKIIHPEFEVINPTLFTPAFVIQNINSNYQYGYHRFRKYKQNPTAQDKRNGIYSPRLTAYQRFKDDIPAYDLHIEFSIPKLLFGNSVQELEDNDLKTIISLLKTRLYRMGIGISEKALNEAVVVKAHFGKNIPLSYPLTAQDAISGLYKADLGKRKDINIRHYGNDGQALYFYASSANIIFYDKLRDIATPKNKAMDKIKLKQEKLLLQGMNPDKQPEILRFEVRFTRQQSLNAFLSKALDSKIKKITFEKIFNKELCQKALITSWEDIIDRPANQLALKIEKSPEEVFDVIIKKINTEQKKKAHSLNKTLASFGLYMMINHCGARKTRNKIEKNWTNKSWTRLGEKVKESAVILEDIPVLPIMSDIQSALEKFEKYNWRVE